MESVNQPPSYIISGTAETFRFGPIVERYAYALDHRALYLANTTSFVLIRLQCKLALNDIIYYRLQPGRKQTCVLHDFELIVYWPNGRHRDVITYIPIYYSTILCHHSF